MARKPKDTAPLTRSVVSSGTLTDNRGNAVTSTTSATVERDYRPFYPYGSIVSLGSRLWRKPTAYYHASRKVELNGDAFIKQGATQASAWTNLIINPDADSMISSSSYGGYPLSTSSTAITETSLRNRAEVKALSSISEQKAGVGEDLATFSQVIEMFHSKASALEAALRFFKEDYRMHRFRHITQRFLRKGYKTFPKDLSELFLEYVYGWKPLVSDLYGTIELLREYSKGVKPIILHGHGQATDTKSRSWAKGKPGWVSTGHWAEFTTSEQSKVRVDLYGQVDPSLVAFRALNQLGLINPVSLAWELIPWSFVVDWFVPIGPVLQAFTAPIGLKLVSGTIAQRISRTHVGTVHAIAGGNSTIYEERVCDVRAYDETYTRVPYSSWPRPSFYIDLNPLRGDRSLKATALAIANLKGG